MQVEETAMACNTDDEEGLGHVVAWLRTSDGACHLQTVLYSTLDALIDLVMFHHPYSQQCRLFDHVM